MKEAKQHKAMYRCGNCAKTIKLRHDADNVACTAHLTIMPTDHVMDCGEYEPVAEPATSTGPESPATPEDSPKAP